MRKRCFKCGEEKDIVNFYKHKGMADGYLNKCKECNKDDVRKNRRENIDYYRQYDRDRSMLPYRVEAREEYSKTDKGRECAIKARIRYRKDNPIKYKAQTAVGNAVRDGILIKPMICECCFIDSDRLHGHHDDYSKPLEVRWLCPRCHSKWHKDNGEAPNG